MKKWKENERQRQIAIELSDLVIYCRPVQFSEEKIIELGTSKQKLLLNLKNVWIAFKIKTKNWAAGIRSEICSEFMHGHGLLLLEVHGLYQVCSLLMKRDAPKCACKTVIIMTHLYSALSWQKLV